MIEKNLISVIIPIYNVEKYLRCCLDSIVEQTYKKMEIILIDDGSSDKCPQICDEYAEKDARIKVIHQENGGLAHARNVGIANSCGEYITFIDSDDYVDTEYMRFLYKGLIESDADISIASFYSFKDGEILQQHQEPVVYEAVSKEYAIKRYCSMNAEYSMPFITAWNKMYRSKLFFGIKYPEGKLYEDAFTTYKLWDKAEKIIFTTSKLYFYRINPKSILGQSFREKHLEMIEAFRAGHEYFCQKRNVKLSEMFVSPLLMREIYCWWGTKMVLNNEILSQKLMNDYRTDCKKLRYGKHIELRWYIVFKLISICPWLYIWYRKLSPIYLGDRR